MTTSLEILSKDWRLGEGLKSKLQQKGFVDFFPVQKLVIPQLLQQNRHTCIYPQDICVSAPTGSGKTLSYALPILNTFLNEPDAYSFRRRLRALIILPSRELALQVYNVFQELVESTSIKTCLTTGSRNFSKEQVILCGNSSGSITSFALGSPHLGHSNFDVMIATPGRLLDHIQFTKGFTLQHLRFLVLDEADRLLGNAYHTWLRNLMTSVENFQTSADTPDIDYVYKKDYKSSRSLKKRSLQYTEDFHEKKARYGEAILEEKGRLIPLQRLLFSATMSEEPAALALMGVKSPIFIKVGDQNGQNNSASMAKESTYADDVWKESYSIPDKLIERFMMVETAIRLMQLCILLLNAYRHSDCDKLGLVQSIATSECCEHVNACHEAGSICLIFVSSVETSSRLTSVLQTLNGQVTTGKKLRNSIKQFYADFNVQPNGQKKLLFGGSVEEMSRLVSANRREEIVQEALNGKVSIIVCSDRMARGIDLPGVKIVLNFDMPKNIKTYLHRAGRTARANRSGICVTFLKKGQKSSFKAMRQEANDNRNDDTFPPKQLSNTTALQIDYLRHIIADALQS